MTQRGKALKVIRLENKVGEITREIQMMNVILDRAAPSKKPAIIERIAALKQERAEVQAELTKALQS